MAIRVIQGNLAYQALKGIWASKVKRDRWGRLPPQFVIAEW